MSPVLLYNTLLTQVLHPCKNLFKSGQYDMGKFDETSEIDALQ